MTNHLTESGVGNRIQAARKLRGLTNSKDLIDAIPGGSMTNATLQNIEAGRKAELTVSQLLNISATLQMPPVYLLAPVGLPEATLDIPNLSRDFDGMTVLQFDAWLAGTTDGAYRWKTREERTERDQLRAMRELESSIRERNRLRSILQTERDSNEDGVGSSEDFFISSEERLDDVVRRISQLTAYLKSAGWELSAFAE